ncbi:MAG: hypothetical protein CFH05_00674 [Alphaproteobacteria bacterium MarineAlpha3_Bin4]|nr:MAG: hypothetical protein CFH05_00674 [Alphaproteobacteria bacterium MarineAlpha3_Bin4]
MKLKKGIKHLVEEAMAEIETMSTEEAIKRYRDDDVLLVDIRDVRELEADGMVPGAVHAPRGMIEFWVDPDSSYHKEVFNQPNKTFVLYCRSSWRSALATKALKDMGMDNGCHFAVGFMAWKVANGPIVERSHWEY